MRSEATRSAQALAIVRGLGGLNPIGTDVVEVAPAYDPSEISARAAAHLACDRLCLWRQRKVAGAR
jgi:agmatinase